MNAHTLSESSILKSCMNKVRATAYLVPDANVAFIPLVPGVEICALGDMVAEELEQVFAFLVPQTFKVGDTLGVNVEGFVAGSLRHSDTLVKSNTHFWVYSDGDSPVARTPQDGSTRPPVFGSLHPPSPPWRP